VNTFGFVWEREQQTEEEIIKERSLDAGTHCKVFEKEITRDRESCVREGHAPRADTRGGTGLPQLSGRHGTAEPVLTGDFSIEFGRLDRGADCIAPRLHFLTQLATGCCRLTLLGPTIL